MKKRSDGTGGGNGGSESVCRCQNPQCRKCFPRLGERRSRHHTGPWGNNHHPCERTTPVSRDHQDTVITRSSSVDLLELVVVLCTSDGTQRHVLKAIRVFRNANLSQIRDVMAAEIPSLVSPHFSFLRIVAGHIVHVAQDQETGSKAYKAKDFAPPRSEKPCLRIYYDRKPLGPPPPPPPPPPHAGTRQRSQGLVDFCVRHMIEGKRDDQGGSVVGMIRLDCDATMSDIRKDLAIQQPRMIPSEYRFVRMLQGEVTLLTLAQESESCKKPLRAYHFMPPYTKKAEIILLTRKSYEEGEIVEDETKTRELKSLARALYNPQVGHYSKGKNPRDMVKEKAACYINSFLNSAGGVLIFGANDNGAIERVPISGSADDDDDDDEKGKKTLDERVRLARAVKDDIRKLVDSVCLNMEPKVADDLVSTLFVPVRRRPPDKGTTTSNNEDRNVLSAEEEIYNVIEIHVKPGRRSLYFMDRHSTEAFERRDGSTHLMDTDAIAEALLSRTTLLHDTPTDLLWRGGWRQLRSSFDFDAQMRRLSDPWAGREWLFAATRQSLFRMVNERNGKYGAGIVGSRGMGKTSFMSELALRPKHVTGLDVVAHHLCRCDDPDTLNPALFVHSLAAMLSRGCKEYRSLMADSSTHPGGDSIGTTMLNALQPEHCESDPDDAFLRGILHPLREIEARHREDGCHGREKRLSPLVVLVDAIDESLSAYSEIRRRGSPTIAHLLERGLMAGGGFPPWIKLVVSFRGDMMDISGPIQSLARRLDVIDLDPTSPMELERARQDIRLFVEAYIEKTRMLSPFGIRVGKGEWTRTMNVSRAKELQALRGEKFTEWQYQAQSGKWVAFDSVAATDLNYAHGILDRCFLVTGKRGFLVDLVSMTQTDLRSGEVLNIRLVQVSVTERADTMSVGPEREKAIAGTASSSGTNPFTKKREDAQNLADQKALVERENKILDVLASNSQGNYLYARSVLEDIRSSRLQFEQIPSLPCGLDHLYTRFFKLHFGHERATDAVNVDAEERKPGIRAVTPVLEVLLAATKRGVTERDIAHAVVVNGACDPTRVAFCLRDIRWALDIDNSGRYPRYSLRHESIRAWLSENANASPFGLRVERGHALLAASLLQRCWPQQTALSNWLQSDNTSPGSLELSPAEASDSGWCRWNGWAPNIEDEDIFNLVQHLANSNIGSDAERVALIKTIGKQNLDSMYRGKTTALHSAAGAGDVSSVKLLLNAQATPDITVRGRRPLHLAASKGYAKIVQLLCSAGADISSPTASGRSALLNASDRGSVSTVKCILGWIESFQENNGQSGTTALVDVSQTDTGRTPLSVAAEEGHDEIVRLLVEARASVFLVDRWGRSPIYYAARSGRAGVIKELAVAPRGQETLSWGESGHNRSPLHEAVWHGHFETVRELLECNADPNLVEKDGGSALHEAAYLGSYGNVVEKRRRDHRNVPLTPSEAQMTEPDASSGVNKNEETIRLEILELLLGTGRCIVNLGETHGCVPLWYAAGGGWTRAVELLLDAGAAVDPGSLPCLSGKARGGPVSPLMRAMECEHYETVRVMLARGAKVPEFEVDACLTSTADIPGDIVDAIRSRAAVQPMGVRSATMDVHGIIGYDMARQCEPVPSEAFAQPSKQAVDEE